MHFQIKSATIDVVIYSWRFIVSQKKKNKRWMKFRHKVVTFIVSLVLIPYCYFKYGLRYKRFKRRGQYLILYNHQTGFDQFFVGMVFGRTAYYMASEDIFSMGFLSSIIRYIIAPIPIKKQTADVRAVMNCIKVAREGGSIAIAPEGNRTYSGRSLYMNPAIVPLARKLGLPIALLRIEGGYGVQPRWSDVVRRGRMYAYVSEVIEPEEYASLDNEQLAKRIETGLYVDEACVTGIFRHKKRAEYLERAMYVCPFCGLSEFESRGSVMECKKCKRKITYSETKELTGMDFDFPFRFVGDWYDYQEKYINSLNTREYTEEPLYRDTVSMSRVIVYKKKELMHKTAELALFGDRVEVRANGAEYKLAFSDISAVTVLGKNKLNVYTGDDIYQFKGDKRFCALKYVNLFFRYKDLLKGEENGEFLGL